MLTDIEDLQILGPIVGLDPIDVVHMFFRQKSASDFLLHDPSVFGQPPSIRRSDPAIFMAVFYALGKTVAFLRAVVFYLDSTGRYEERLKANLTAFGSIREIMCRFPDDCVESRVFA